MTSTRRRQPSSPTHSWCASDNRAQYHRGAARRAAVNPRRASTADGTRYAQAHGCIRRASRRASGQAPNSGRGGSPDWTIAQATRPQSNASIQKSSFPEGSPLLVSRYRAMAEESIVMTGTERKRAWRLDHPERAREAERTRAQARRNGYWQPILGQALVVCASSDSYWRYENTMKRFKQRLFWPRYGAGTTTMTREEFRAQGKIIFAEAIRSWQRRAS